VVLYYRPKVTNEECGKLIVLKNCFVCFEVCKEFLSIYI